MCAHWKAGSHRFRAATLVTAQPGNGPHVRQQRKNEQTAVQSRPGSATTSQWAHASGTWCWARESHTEESTRWNPLSFFLFNDAQNQAKPISAFGIRTVTERAVTGRWLCSASWFENMSSCTVTYALIYIHLSIMLPWSGFFFFKVYVFWKKEGSCFLGPLAWPRAGKHPRTSVNTFLSQRRIISPYRQVHGF